MAAVTLYTTKPKFVSQIPVKNGNLIFVEDTGKICFDFNDKRNEYNTLFTFKNEQARQDYPAIVEGYYFVKGSGCLWYFDPSNGWRRITKRPEDVVNFTDELPKEGKKGTLYVNQVTQVVYSWDENNKKYIAVSNFTKTILEEDIDNLFK